MMFKLLSKLFSKPHPRRTTLKRGDTVNVYRMDGCMCEIRTFLYKGQVVKPINISCHTSSGHIKVPGYRLMVVDSMSDYPVNGHQKDELAEYVVVSSTGEIDIVLP